jgi:hypothetical protein
MIIESIIIGAIFGMLIGFCITGSMSEEQMIARIKALRYARRIKDETDKQVDQELAE